MQVRTQFSIFVVNRPGVLAGITGMLAEAGVNLQALCLADSGEGGVLRCVCDDPEAARKVLDEKHDRWTETEVLVLEMTNHPGGFAAIAKKLGDARVNISYAYATASKQAGTTIAVFKVADMKRAKEILAEA
ncbi:MAG TPA: ACT domain-containing protein [Phycisphaerae bacterium]|nr:ACT domain-containing protein [Phycisphaerae bacterium]